MRALTLASALVLILAVALGGATRAGFMGDVVVQLAASGLLCFALWRWMDLSDERLALGRLGWAFLAILAGLAVLQLAPTGLVAEVTPAFPTGGEQAIATEGRGWQLSWAPQATWAALASLIVPIAVFAAVAQLDLKGRMLLWRIVLVLGGVALVLGFAQVLQGRDSALRFFAITNPEDAVGFFANRNHFAAQLYVTLVLASVWIAMAARAAMAPGAGKTSAMLSLAGAAALMIVLSVGIALARSRAGLILAMAGVVALGAMALVDAMRRGISLKGGWSAGRTMIAVLAVATLLAAQFGLTRVSTRFDGGSVLDDLRVPLNITTVQTALGTLPFGTGLGSFVPVYATVEKPADAFAGYANRAHNDLAELLLETGLVGLVLLALFFWWFVPRAAAAWRAPARGPQGDLERAAALVVVLLLAHSLVDYPLRTSAVAALVAFACALLVPPAPEPPAPKPAAVARPTRAARTPPLFDDLPVAAPPRPAEVGSWTDKIEWPDAWKPDR